MRRTTDGSIIVICDGNSLTRGFGASSAPLAYPAQLDALCSSAVVVTNLGVDGQTTAQMWSDYLSQVRPLASSRADRNVLILWEVLNSLYMGATPRAAVDTLWAMVDRAAISGYDVRVCTVIAASSVSAPLIAEANGYIRAGGYRLIDLAADARLSNSSNLTYYNADGVHLTDAGYGVVAAIIKDALALP